MPAPTTKGKIRRTIKLYSVPLPVLVTISEEGVDLRIQGSKKGVMASWHRIATYAVTPTDVPSFLFDRPLEFLKSQAEASLKKSAGGNK
jgi:hypothetical protein